VNLFESRESHKGALHLTSARSIQEPALRAHLAVPMAAMCYRRALARRLRSVALSPTVNVLDAGFWDEFRVNLNFRREPSDPSVVTMSAAHRLSKEIADIIDAETKAMESDACIGWSIGPASEESVFKWKGSIDGPAGTPYEGGRFEVAMDFPADYPHMPVRAFAPRTPVVFGSQ
jgi:hypothetical protein